MCVELTTGTRLARRAILSIAIGCAAWIAPLQASADPAPEAIAASTRAPASIDLAPIELKFSQFFETPIGPAGLALSEALRRADGRAVRLVGYMVAQEQARPGRFWLTRRPPSRPSAP